MNAENEKIEIRDVILGGQDGLVNVLGLSLGLFAAHATTHIIIVAGLAAGFSEAVSMGAVAYTSATADKVRLASTEMAQIVFSSFVVGLAALVFSAVPLAPFLFIPIDSSIAAAVVISAIILFILGVFKAKSVGGSWIKSGFQIVVIGMLSALAGFAIGFLLKVQA